MRPPQRARGDSNDGGVGLYVLCYNRARSDTGSVANPKVLQYARACSYKNAVAEHGSTRNCSTRIQRTAIPNYGFMANGATDADM